MVQEGSYRIRISGGRKEGGRKNKKAKDAFQPLLKKGLWRNELTARHRCPALSWPLRLGSVNSDAAGLGSPMPVRALGHESHLPRLGIPVVFEDTQLLLPRENKRVYSPHSSPSLLPAFLVVP